MDQNQSCGFGLELLLAIKSQEKYAENVDAEKVPLFCFFSVIFLSLCLLAIVSVLCVSVKAVFVIVYSLVGIVSSKEVSLL